MFWSKTTRSKQEAKRSMFMTIMVKQTKKLKKKKNICKCMEVFNYMFFAAKKKQYL